MFENSRAANPVALEPSLSQQRLQTHPLCALSTAHKATAPAFIGTRVQPP